jgi:xanthine/uracil/vitamin C permease (AzgA family)
MLERLFQLEAHGTDLKTEVVAGITTFLTMAYIIVVNPSLLAETGMDYGAVFVATCLAAALGSLIMGLLANYAIALAPGMGLNAFFTFTVVGQIGYSWRVALIALHNTDIIIADPATLVTLGDVIAPAALLYVATLMTSSLSHIDWEDATDAAPALVTALAMPLAFSIADGIAPGFVAYVAIKLLSGRLRQLNAALVAIAALFVLKFVLLG